MVSTIDSAGFPGCFMFGVRIISGECSDEVRARIRQNQSKSKINLLEKAVRKLSGKMHLLPQSNLGKALTYAHNQWIKLCKTNKHSISLDNNRAENAVRPLKLGAKNWLFIGSEDTGWRSAVIFTIIENVRILGYDPYEYLEWVFGKLPAISNQNDLRPLLPKAWVEGCGRDAHAPLER